MTVFAAACATAPATPRATLAPRAVLTPAVALEPVELARESPLVSAGREVFRSACAVCHRDDGGGIIGPNLTDDAWLHGRGDDEIERVVRLGVIAHGMPAFGENLGDDRLREVVAYVLILRGTRAPGGRRADGTTDAGPTPPP